LQSWFTSVFRVVGFIPSTPQTRGRIRPGRRSLGVPEVGWLLSIGLGFGLDRRDPQHGHAGDFEKCLTR